MEEFVAVFRQFCTPQTIFIATKKPRKPGFETKFAITLKDGKPVMRGQARVSQAFEDKDNRYGRPGMLLEFMELDSMGKILLEELTASTALHALGGAGESGGDAGSAEGADDSNETGERPTFVLPANPFGELPDQSLQEFVECTLFEETGSFDLAALGIRKGEDETEAAPAPEPKHASIPSIPAFGAEKTPIPQIPKVPLPGLAATAVPQGQNVEESGPTATIPGGVPSSLVGAEESGPSAAPAEPEAAGQPWAVPQGASAPSERPLPGVAPAPVNPAGPAPMQGAAPMTPVPGSLAPVQGVPPQGIPPQGGPQPPMGPQPMATPNPGGLQPGVMAPAPEPRRRPTWPLVAGIAAVTLFVGLLIGGAFDSEEPEVEAAGDKSQTAVGGPEGEELKEPVAEPAAPSDPAVDKEEADEAAADADGAEEETKGQTAEELVGSEDTGADAPEEEPPSGDEATPAVATTDLGTTACSIDLVLDPKDAKLSIGGNALPSPFDGAVPCGEITLQAEHPRYETKTKTLTLVEGERQKVKMRLARPFYTIKIVTKPKGAKVQMGRYGGFRSPGKQKVRGYERFDVIVTAPGYNYTKKSVYPKRDQTIKINLQPLRKAKKSSKRGRRRR
jgi:hypothetical protein